MRVVEFNSSTPFAEQLRVMQETGVFVSAHTSNLANAVFLQPGSAVVEIIQVGHSCHTHHVLFTSIVADIIASVAFGGRRQAAIHAVQRGLVLVVFCSDQCVLLF